MTSSNPKPSGLVKGPGATAHSFTFVSPDTRNVLKIGEFITYQIHAEGEYRKVLARVIERRLLRQYPSSFLANPEVSPVSVASLVGYEQDKAELFELTAEVVGYFDSATHSFINPRISPRAGSTVYLAEDEYLSHVLSRSQLGEIGSAEVGWLLSRERGSVPIAVDMSAICSTHLAIIASTGAGKSYLASVLLEEMLKPNNRAAVLVIDPHAEYKTLDHIRAHDQFRDVNYQAEVKIFQPGKVKVRVGSLSLADLSYLLPDLTERMEYVLRLAFQRAQRRSRQERGGDPERWTLQHLRQALAEIGGSKDPENSIVSTDDDDGEGKYKDTTDAVLWRLNSALAQNLIFDDESQTGLRDLIHPGQCTVLQLNEVDARQQQVMIATLLRRLYTARVQTTKELVGNEDALYLPYPVFVLIEEAHHFTPANANVASTGILKQILAEGRKFGVGVGLISQRPGKLDGDVLSQCNTQFLMRIVNPVDQARVRESVESVGQDLLNELPALTKGQAIVAGNAVNTPVLCHIRPRITPHGAEDISAPKEWMHYFDPVEQERRDREQARPEVSAPKSLKWKK